MKIYRDEPLGTRTSFGSGGKAKTLVEIDSVENFVELIKTHHFEKPFWFIGYGTNILISDRGLDGTVFVLRSKPQIQFDEKSLQITTSSTTWWDDLVKFAVDKKLWGMELMSGIPGGVGAAVYGDIGAYGQAISNTLKSIEIIDTVKLVKRTISAEKLHLDYRFSELSTSDYKNSLIASASFQLSNKPTTKLEYGGALAVAKELNLDPKQLAERRKIILEARSRAGSLFSTKHRTAGSFFKNPIVTPKQIDYLMSFDEHGVQKKVLKKQNQIHGGNTARISAALVMLAAGFKRGQTWGQVRLHPDHILKIENIGTATSQEIRDIADMIIKTVKQKLNITLESEVKYLGKFD